jgi:hypothetical protein
LSRAGTNSETAVKEYRRNKYLQKNYAMILKKITFALDEPRDCCCDAQASFFENYGTA